MKVRLLNNKRVLTSREKVLYHQIHPVKLCADIGSSLLSTYLFWIHQLILGLLGGFIPSIVASAVIIRYVDLGEYVASPLGKYVGKYMTGSMQAVRLAGQFVVWFGAWYRVPSIAGVGYLIVILGWIRGRIIP